MIRRILLTNLTALVALLLLPPFASAQFREEETVNASINVLREAMTAPLYRIPESMLSDARGVAIIPNVIKGSFVIGARRGKGVLLVRDAEGRWTAPVFITLTGGNIGWQIGVQSSDLVLVFKTQKSVDGILSGKFTIGADAAAAAGPVGRQAAAATDGKLQAEIYSYSRSRGLFVGVSVDGSVLQIDNLADAAYYRAPAPGAPVEVPEAASELVGLVATYAEAGERPAGPVDLSPEGLTPTPAAPAKSEADAVRGELAKTAMSLYAMVDGSWQSYLALPAGVFNGDDPPSTEALDAALSRFDAVARDPRYRTLTQRPEFQQTFGLLQTYRSLQAQTASTLQLPPPPSLQPVPVR